MTKGGHPSPLFVFYDQLFAGISDDSHLKNRVLENCLWLPGIPCPVYNGVPHAGQLSETVVPKRRGVSQKHAS